MDRCGFSIRRQTTISQKLPQDYEEKLTKFQRYVMAKWKEHNFDLKYIGNADQTPLTFDIVTNSTVAEKGVKSVPLLSTGHEKDRFTVMLTCLGDGTKLPPYVVFKRKTLPKNWTFSKEVVVRCQAKGWMDKALVQDWLRTVWNKVGGISRKVELDEICRWISAAWNDIPTEMIAKSFCKCCITNAMDGTEDEEIWEEESDSDPFADIDELDGDEELYYADDFE